jgi:thiol-disulfide isomerase/thioredoxin
MRALFAAALFSVLAVHGAEIPRPSPDYTITFPDGQKTSVLQQKGKVLAVEFMLTTCSHCQDTAKILTRLHKEFGAKGFEPLGIAINPNPRIPEFISTFKVSYPIGTGSHEGAYTYLQQSLMNQSLQMPQLVFIDRAGMIRGQFQRSDSFFENEEKNARALVIQLLQDQAGKKAATTTPKKRTS